jgi:hypothetical protein
MSLAGQNAGVSVRQVRRLVSRVWGDEAMVVPIMPGKGGSESVYTFNESGTKLWSMIEDGRKIAELADYLCLEYGLSSEQAAADAAQFVAELTQEGLIELA